MAIKNITCSLHSLPTYNDEYSTCVPYSHSGMILISSVHFVKLQFTLEREKLQGL